MGEPGVLDPRILCLPPRILAELGVNLRPYARRWMEGGCPRCVGLIWLRPPERGNGWSRLVRHHPACRVPAYGGRVPGAVFN
jgi:hypothetical protein